MIINLKVDSWETFTVISFLRASPKSPFSEAVLLFCFAVSPEAGVPVRRDTLPLFSFTSHVPWLHLAACVLRQQKTKDQFSREQSGDQIDVKTAAQLWGFRSLVSAARKT